MNLFIAIILQAFEESVKQDNAVIKQADYQKFKKLWMKYDTKGRGLIREDELDFFLQEIDKPLGDPKWKYSESARSKFLMQEELPVYEIPG